MNTQAKKTAREVIHVRDYDAVIFSCVVLLTLFGTFMIFSSSYYTSMTDKKFNYDMMYFLTKQLIALALGFVALFVAAFIDYNKWKALVPLMYAAANVLLVVVKFVGEEVYGAKRWLRVGGVSFQPSEFAKVSVILLLALYLSRNKYRATTLKGWLGALAIVGLPCVLVFWGKNLSTAIIIFAIGFGMMFVASPYFWRFVAAAGAAVAGLMAIIFTGDEFRGARVKVWLDPFSDPQGYGYQIIQSLYAVASGGWFGLGPGKSVQKLIFLSEPYNDFIFAIVCEEFGFFGALVVLLLFGALIWRSARTALGARDLYGTLIAAGAVMMLGTQTLINVAVVTNSIPNTGIPMPFISYGGTSLVFVMALMGVLLNVSRYSKKYVYE